MIRPRTPVSGKNADLLRKSARIGQGGGDGAAIADHVERFLTYVTRQQRITRERLDKISELFDSLLLYRECLADCDAITDLHKNAQELLKLESQETEVIEDMAESNLRMVRDSDGL